MLTWSACARVYARVHVLVIRVGCKLRPLIFSVTVRSAPRRGILGGSNQVLRFRPLQFDNSDQILKKTTVTYSLLSKAAKVVIFKSGGRRNLGHNLTA